MWFKTMSLLKTFKKYKSYEINSRYIIKVTLLIKYIMWGILFKPKY